MITRPLDLESRLSPPPRDLDFFAWVNVTLIALFFALLGSRFVLAPGLLIGLGEPARPMGLPSVGSTSESPIQASIVVSYRSKDFILFEGGVYSLANLQKQMTDYAKKHPGAVLLVRADGNTSIQDFADLSEVAKLAGFTTVQLAGESSVAVNPIK